MAATIRSILVLHLIFAACVFATVDRAAAQIKAAEENPYLRFGETHVSRYQVGATLKATKGPVQQGLAAMAIPFTCAEQDVEIVDQDVSPHVDMVEYRLLNEFAEGGARQMLISIPYLAGGEEARAVVTFEVRTRTILPPEDPSSLTIPTKPNRDLKKFLGRSPYIETNHAKIKKTLREIEASRAASSPRSQEGQLTKETRKASESTDDNGTASEDIAQENDAEAITDWQRVKAIYEYVQDHVDYVEGPDKSAVKTLADASGDCQNISVLFVALCRTAGVPARIVWVHEHNYAEFCLVDSEGEPHWFPCESSGTRAFGEMPLARTILQKGDNFKVPERPRERLRYASDYTTVLPVGNSGRPRFRSIRNQL